jgi:hypothetical protein
MGRMLDALRRLEDVSESSATVLVSPTTRPPSQNNDDTRAEESADGNPEPAGDPERDSRSLTEEAVAPPSDSHTPAVAWPEIGAADEDDSPIVPTSRLIPSLDELAAELSIEDEVEEQAFSPEEQPSFSMEDAQPPGRIAGHDDALSRATQPLGAGWIPDFEPGQTADNRETDEDQRSNFASTEVESVVETALDSADFGSLDPIVPHPNAENRYGDHPGHVSDVDIDSVDEPEPNQAPLTEEGFPREWASPGSAVPALDVIPMIEKGLSSDDGQPSDGGGDNGADELTPDFTPTRIARAISLPTPGPLVSAQVADLCRNIVGQLQGSGLRSIALLHAGRQKDQAGRLAARLAIAMADSSEARILLVDGHGQREGIATCFDLGDAPGWAEVVGGRVSLRDVAQGTKFPKLHIMSAGLGKWTTLPDARDRLANTLKESRAGYQFVLIDGGSYMEPAGRALAQACDGAYLLIQAGFTSERSAKAALRRLREWKVRLLGGVLTHAREDDESLFVS